MLTLSIFDDETIRSVFEHKPDELIIDGDFKATYNICIGEYVPLVSIPKFRTWLRDEMKKEFPDMESDTFNMKFDELIELIKHHESNEMAFTWANENGYTEEFEENDLMFHYMNNMFGSSEFCDECEFKYGEFDMRESSLYLNRVFIGHVISTLGCDDSKAEEVEVHNE